MSTQPHFISRILRTDQSIILYIVQASVLAWVPLNLLYILAKTIFPRETAFRDPFSTPYEAIFITSICTPILETQIMRLIFYILRNITSHTSTLCIISAIIWGGLHFKSDSSGIHAVWAFYVLGVCYLQWRHISKTKAIWITTAVHSLCNLISYASKLLFDT